jgi:putative oxidoreductase
VLRLRPLTSHRGNDVSIFEPARPPWPGRMLSIFRIVAGVVFISFGTMKLFGFPPSPVPNMPPILPFSQMWIGGVLEVVGGTFIALGLLTRPVAFVLAGEMAVAYWQFHAPTSPFPPTNMGVPAVMYCFFYLYLTFSGPGPWSLDALIARSRGERTVTS